MKRVLVFLVFALALWPRGTRACGPCPIVDLQGLVVRRDQHVTLKTNFGLILREDDRWLLSCDGSYKSAQATALVETASGALALATSAGLQVSRSGGCSWFPPQGLEAQPAVDVATDADRIWELGVDAPTGKANLFSSSDDGVSFNKVDLNVPVFPKNIRAKDDNLLFAGYALSPYRFAQYVSSDLGVSWTSTVPPDLANKEAVDLLATSDDLEHVYYAERMLVGGDPETLWISTDGGRTVRRSRTLDGRQKIRGFALGATISDLYMAGAEIDSPEVVRGVLYVSHDGGATFDVLTDGPPFRCLAWNAGTLYACIQDVTRIVSTSLDDGRAWRTLFALSDVQIAPCLSSQCDTTLQWLCGTFGACGDGSVTDGGGFSLSGSRPRSDATGCDVARGSPMSADVRPFSLLLLLGLLSLRRRKCT